MRRMPVMFIVVAGFLLFRFADGNLVPLVVVGVVVVVGLVVYRGYVSRRERRRGESIERADVGSLTEKVESMLGETANKILEVEDRPTLSETPEAVQHFQKAVGIFASVDDRLESTTTVGQLRSLISELDDAVWGLDAARAVLDGEELPAPTRTLPLPTPPPSSPRVSVRESSSEAIARWVDGGSGRHHRRRGRSC